MTEPLDAQEAPGAPRAPEGVREPAPEPRKASTGPSARAEGGEWRTGEDGLRCAWCDAHMLDGHKPDCSRPTVETRPDGTVVLRDPMAEGVMAAVGRHNCKRSAAPFVERLRHFGRRLAVKRREHAMEMPDPIIVLINRDAPYGDALDELMPGHDWQAYRDRKEVPFGLGLVPRVAIQGALDDIDPREASILRMLIDRDTVVVIDHGVIAVFKLCEVLDA